MTKLQKQKESNKPSSDTRDTTMNSEIDSSFASDSPASDLPVERPVSPFRSPALAASAMNKPAVPLSITVKTSPTRPLSSPKSPESPSSGSKNRSSVTAPSNLRNSISNNDYPSTLYPPNQTEVVSNNLPENFKFRKTSVQLGPIKSTSDSNPSKVVISAPEIVIKEESNFTAASVKGITHSEFTKPVLLDYSKATGLQDFVARRTEIKEQVIDVKPPTVQIEKVAEKVELKSKFGQNKFGGQVTHLNTPITPSFEIEVRGYSNRKAGHAVIVGTGLPGAFPDVKDLNYSDDSINEMVKPGKPKSAFGGFDSPAETPLFVIEKREDFESESSEEESQEVVENSNIENTNVENTKNPVVKSSQDSVEKDFLKIGEEQKSLRDSGSIVDNSKESLEIKVEAPGFNNTEMLNVSGNKNYPELVSFDEKTTVDSLKRPQKLNDSLSDSAAGRLVQLESSAKSINVSMEMKMKYEETVLNASRERVEAVKEEVVTKSILSPIEAALQFQTENGLGVNTKFSLVMCPELFSYVNFNLVEFLKNQYSDVVYLEKRICLIRRILHFSCTMKPMKSS